MKNKFYHHILKIEPVQQKLDVLNLSDDEKKELLDLLHSHIHITVVDVILSELSEGKKKEFLHLIAIKEDHTTAWDFVITNIEKGEDKVKKAIEQIVKDFIKDLEEEG